MTTIDNPKETISILGGDDLFVLFSGPCFVVWPGHCFVTPNAALERLAHATTIKATQLAEHYHKSLELIGDVELVPPNLKLLRVLESDGD